MDSKIPKEPDWGDWESDLDKKSAHKIYAGKSNEEMEERYTIGPIEVCEDLRFMPVVPFQYYMLGFSEVVVSNKYDELNMPDAASCFLRLVLYKLKNDRSDILPIMDTLKAAIDNIVENQDKYDADIDIYGDFNEVKAEIENLWLAR